MAIAAWPEAMRAGHADTEKPLRGGLQVRRHCEEMLPEVRMELARAVAELIVVFLGDHEPLASNRSGKLREVQDRP